MRENNPAIISMLACLLLVCSPARADEALDRLFGMAPLDTFTIQSETLGRDFHIYVRKPLRYDAVDCDWPVVYVLDGGILFPMLSPYQLMLEIDGLAPPLVMVGISYGGLGFSNGNYRSTDYTAPADEPDYFGGAFAYQDFLADELIPRIQADYRVDQGDSLILGQSLGGQFTLLTALTRPELFGHYLSINPALHANLDYFLALEPAERDQATPVMITRATEEEPRFSGPLQQWLTDWRARADPSLRLETRWLAGEYHASSAPAAYRIAVEWWGAKACAEWAP
jgi:predicted alpha/beta superfamily hydrolase